MKSQNKSTTHIKMAMSFGGTGLILANALTHMSRTLCVIPRTRAIHSTAVCCKHQAARIRVGKGDKPVTYEKAHPPHHIAHRKGWLSQHTSNLDGETGAAERTVEDIFIRRFIFGTFHSLLANELVIKRRGNMLVVCALFARKIPAYKFYFLIGYTETLLSYFYKCPVKMEVQTVKDKVVYKYL